MDGTYYLLTAEGGTHTNHMVVAARSNQPTGPFEGCSRNPVLSHRGHPMRSIKATGHGDLVRVADGTWWLIFLGIRQQGDHPGWHHLGRETFLAPVGWQDGWPVVNGGDPIEIGMDVDSLSGETLPVKPAEPARPTHEFFEDDTLDGAFEYRRNPDPEAYSLAERYRGLTLWARTPSLDDPEATFVGRRQAHFASRTTADLVFDPEEGEEAGLAAVMDERHHYEIGVRRRDGRTRVVVRLRIGDATDLVAETPVEGSVRLGIDTTADGIGSGTTLRTAAFSWILRARQRSISLPRWLVGSPTCTSACTLSAIPSVERRRPGSNGLLTNRRASDAEAIDDRGRTKMGARCHRFCRPRLQRTGS